MVAMDAKDRRMIAIHDQRNRIIFGNGLLLIILSIMFIRDIDTPIALDILTWLWILLTIYLMWVEHWIKMYYPELIYDFDAPSFADDHQDLLLDISIGGFFFLMIALLYMGFIGGIHFDGRSILGGFVFILCLIYFLIFLSVRGSD